MQLACEHETAWYRQFWPWFLISLPGTTVVAALFTIGIAIDSNDGLVDDAYYKQGLAIYKDAAQAERAKALGVVARLGFDGQGQVAVSLNDGVPVDMQALVLWIKHPTRPNRDQRVLLERTADGSFIGRLQPLETANWRLTLAPDHLTWRLDGRAELPGSAVVTMD